jgi:2-dehydro-3-deoxyphosphogalactonate aldolase
MTDPAERFAQVRLGCPLVAILRGVRPDQIDAIADAIVDAGIAMIEVPMNSPDPLTSIARLARRHGTHCLIGAGTVLHPTEVAQIADAGGQLIVSPNCNPAVIRATIERGMVALPGCQTATEAFLALDAGVSGLKLFPAEALSASAVRALSAVLPNGTVMFAVGGITPDTMTEWWQAGVSGFGIGGALFRPSDDAAKVSAQAAAFVAAAKALTR